MARIYGYYCPVAHVLEVEHNLLAQTLQIDGTPERVKEFLHTVGVRNSKSQSDSAKPNQMGESKDR